MSNEYSMKSDLTETLCSRLHVRMEDQKPSDATPNVMFEKRLREMIISWTLGLENGPEFVGRMLLHYGRLLTQADTTLFREVLDQMIAERQEQGDFHEDTH